MLLDWLLYAVALWAICLLILLGIGILLSHITLTTARRPSPKLDPIYKTHYVIRITYRVVVAITSAYCYVSIPVLAAVILVLSLIFLDAGIPAITLILWVQLGIVFIGLFAPLKPREMLGRLITPSEAPQLWASLDAIAAHVGTRPVDEVYVAPTAIIGVMERGSVLQKLIGRGQRRLVLGLGVLPGMTQHQFKAILAHEYGHFCHRDWVGGQMAIRIQHSIHQMILRLAVGRLDNWLNPAWIFIQIFYRVYLRITLGASRLQEIQADHRAAATYGPEHCISALLHITRQNLTFKMHAPQKIERSMQTNLDCLNLYTLSHSRAETLPGFSSALEKALNRPTSPYDSHPAVVERIEFLASRPKTPDCEEKTDPVWMLFPNAEALQEEMTRLLVSEVVEWKKKVM